MAVSFESPEYTANCDALGTLRILEAIKSLGLEKNTFLSSKYKRTVWIIQETPQREETPFYPRSPYAVAKLYSYWITINLERLMVYSLVMGFYLIMRAQEGETFVTRKITRGLSRISLGLENCLYLGNINAKRDWGHAKDYVEMQWRMLQQETPEDYVIATGKWLV